MGFAGVLLIAVQMSRSPESTRVAVLGASPSRERFSNKAVHRLSKAGYETIPINPNTPEVAGIPCLPDLGMTKDIDTVTIYLSAKHSGGLEEQLVALAPRRVIFNPGAENPELRQNLEKKHIICIEACTLVMLDVGSF